MFSYFKSLFKKQYCYKCYINSNVKTMCESVSDQDLYNQIIDLSQDDFNRLSKILNGASDIRNQKKLYLENKERISRG